MFFFSSVFAGLLLLLLSLPLNGCKDEFTTDPEYKLTMPDSLLFDTVISQTISPTAAFKIYNKTEEDIKIASITLNSSLNYFKININGKSGTSFSNVELRSGDSLFVFVQIVADCIRPRIRLVPALSSRTDCQAQVPGALWLTSQPVRTASNWWVSADQYRSRYLTISLSVFIRYMAKRVLQYPILHMFSSRLSRA